MNDKYISVKVLEEIMRRHKPEYGQDKSKERYAYIEWLGILNAIRRECQPIEAAPAVDSAQWIPVTERLPEKPGKYLVTVRNGNVYAGTYSAYEKRFQCAAIAWMELPEPWRGESDERLA